MRKKAKRERKKKKKTKKSNVELVPHYRGPYPIILIDTFAEGH